MAADGRTGLNGHLPRILGVVRVGMHAHVALARFDQQRRARWLALGAVAVAVDAQVIRRLAAQRPLPFARWLALDVADVAAWSVGTSAGHDIQAPMVGTGWTHAALRTYLSTVGRDAQPVHADTRPYPPTTAPDAARRIGENVAIWLAPLAVAEAIHRRRGLRVPKSMVLWPVLGTVSGATLGRVRRRQHARAAVLWRQRSALGAQLQARSVRFRIVTGIEELHDLPRLLAILGEHSPRCREISLGSRDLPRHLASDEELGEPLGRTLPYHEVEPASARMLWLARRDADLLREGVARAEAAPIDPDDEVLRFLGRQGTTLRFSHQGHELTVRSGPTIADVTFDPVAAGLLASGLVKLITHRGDRIPTSVGVTCAALEVLGAAATLRGELTGRRHVRGVVTASLLSSALWLGAVRFTPVRELRSDGSAVFPATGATSVLGPLAHYWAELPRWTRASAGVVVASWFEAMRAREHRPTVAATLAEALTVAQYFVATFRFVEASDAEREGLQDRLQAEHDRQMVAIEQQTWAAELDRYAWMCDVAVEELEAIASRGDLPPRDVDRLRADLAAIDRWIAAARGRHVAPADEGMAA